jgi:2-methylisocitrate lyase-like PEP mutase family enzyme
MKSFETFLQLHAGPDPLLLGNIWDVNSAKLFEKAGYKAIGTSSQAVASSLGYEDGEHMPFDTLLQLAEQVVKSVDIPVTIDIEGGFSRSVAGIIDHIEKLHDAGVAGINLEDTVLDGSRMLQSVTAFQKTLTSVANHLCRKNLKIFLNIRTDGFLLGMPDALAETLGRLSGYKDAGANGIFVPCITDIDDIKVVAAATDLPVNVMCMPSLPNFGELKAAGVRRISMGPFVYSYITRKAAEAVGAVLESDDFSLLFN